MSAVITSDQEKIDLFVSLRYGVVQSLYADQDDFILTFDTSIEGSVADDSSEQKIILGKLKMYLIQIGNAVNEGVSLFQVFDTFQQTLDAGTAIFDSGFQNFNRWISRRFEEASSWDDILLLDRLTLNPIVRGQRLGLAIINRAMRDWSSGCSLIVMKPFPLQYEGGDGQISRRNVDKIAKHKLEKFTLSRAESFRRLRNYYAQLGFERIAKSQFYAFCPKEKMPSTESLSIPDSFTVSKELLKTYSNFSPE